MLNKLIKSILVLLIFSFSMIFSSILLLEDSNLKVYAAVQNTFYVSSTGSDSNPGTSSLPFLTIEKARSTVATVNSNMTGDIIVYIKAGMYYLNSPIYFQPSDSGTNGYNIIYKNWDSPGSARVIGGRSETGGWTLHSGNIYKKNVGTTYKFDTMFENGVRAVLARTPNIGNYKNIASIINSNTFTFNSGDIPSIATPSTTRVCVWSGGYGGSNYDWSTNRLPITSINYGTRRVAFTGSTDYGIVANNRYYIEGALELLDQAGEFYYDKSTGYLYYWSRTGNINSQDIVCPTTGVVFQFWGSSSTSRVHNIQIDGLSIEKRNILSGVTNNGMGSLFMYCAKDIAIRNCKITGAGENAISMIDYCSNVTIYGNYINDIGGSGVNLYSEGPHYLTETNTNNFISNNNISSCGVFYGYSAGVLAQYSGHNTITHNRIHNNPRFGIMLNGKPFIYMEASYDGVPVTWANHYDFIATRDNKVEYNDISMCNLDSQDTGAIDLHATGRNNIINNNRVYSNGQNGSFAIQSGIYLDADASYSTVKNNIVFNSGAGLILKGYYNYVYNNIFNCNNTYSQTIYGIFQKGNLDSIGISDGEAETHFQTVNGNVWYDETGGSTVYNVWDWSNDLFSSSDYNTFYNSSGVYNFDGVPGGNTWTNWQNLGYDANSIIGSDPLFKSVFNNNYRLMSGSPALARGFVNIDQESIGLKSDYIYEIIYNGQFSNGIDGWYACGGTISDGGGYCVSQGRTANWNAARQYVHLVNDNTYAFSTKVKLSSGTDTVYLFAAIDVNGSEYVRAIGSATVGTSWTTLSGTYTFNEAAPIDSATVFVSTSSSLANVSTDDFSITNTSGCITNKGYENGLSKWTANSGTASIVTSGQHSGTKAALLSGRTATWNAITMECASLINGRTYNFSGWAKLASGSDTLYMFAQYNIGGTEYYRLLGSSTVGTTWTQISGTYTFNEAAPITSAKIYISTNTSTANVYTDDFSVDIAY